MSGRAGKKRQSGGRGGGKESKKRKYASTEQDPPTYPAGVKIIARRNRPNHFCIPRKDTTVCGMPCERIVINSGCNTVLLPFPERRKRSQVLRGFTGATYKWEIAWSGGTGGINCLTLKIHPVADDDIGVMKFFGGGAEAYECPIPFLRFHLGSEAARWLINNPGDLDDHNIGKLRQFLNAMGSNNVDGRTVALIGQMLLSRLCVVQVGGVMFLMEARDESINPLRLHHECLHATNRLVESYDGFDDLFDDDNELYDRDGLIPLD